LSDRNEAHETRRAKLDRYCLSGDELTTITGHRALLDACAHAFDPPSRPYKDRGRGTHAIATTRLDKLGGARYSSRVNPRARRKPIEST
jgi:hypothetical protein